MPGDFTWVQYIHALVLVFYVVILVLADAPLILQRALWKGPFVTLDNF